MIEYAKKNGCDKKRGGGEHSPPSLLQLHTRIIVHPQTAAQQQYNGIYEARMSWKCGEGRD